MGAEGSRFLGFARNDGRRDDGASGLPTDIWPLRHCSTPSYPVCRKHGPLPKTNRPLRLLEFGVQKRSRQGQPRKMGRNGREWEGI